MSGDATLAVLAEKDTNADACRTVLFVCTGNTCRSPMAAALFHHLMAGDAAKNQIPSRAISAGLFAKEGDPITPLAAEVLLEAGVLPTPENDYTAHRARTVSEELIRMSDEVVAISGSHAMQLMLRYPAYASKITTLPLDIPDPFGGTKDTYRACLDLLSAAIHLRWQVGEGEV